VVAREELASTWRGPFAAGLFEGLIAAQAPVPVLALDNDEKSSMTPRAAMARRPRQAMPLQPFLNLPSSHIKLVILVAVRSIASTNGQQSTG
jgi:hypothetical protein